MKHSVFITAEAEKDIFDLYTYIANKKSVEEAEYVFNKINEVCRDLATFPERGHYPPELERIDIYNFREVFFKPYRIIYQILEKSVYVHCILDGRREMAELLQKRLLR